MTAEIRVIAAGWSGRYEDGDSDQQLGPGSRSWGSVAIKGRFPVASEVSQKQPGGSRVLRSNGVVVAGGRRLWKGRQSGLVGDMRVENLDG